MVLSDNVGKTQRTPLAGSDDETLLVGHDQWLGEHENCEMQ